MSLGSSISNILMPGLSIGQNAVGLAKANKDVKNAQGMVIPMTDWRQQEAYESLKDKARALETGAAYAPQQAAIQQQGLGAMSAATRVAGGDTGATLGALANINRSTGRLVNELYGGMSMEGLQLQNLLASTAKSMADRAYQIQGWNKSQALGDAMKRKQQYQQNLTTAMSDIFGGGLVGSAVDTVFGGKKKTQSANISVGELTQVPSIKSALGTAGKLLAL